MPDVKITFQEVRDKAQQLRGHNTKLSDLLTNIQRTINALEADYSSDTSVTIRDRITGMQPVFDSYREVVESYAAFLDSTAEQFEETENTLNTNAASQFSSYK